ncbi:GntR family transcriptional regulator, partial [Escherichia coli]|uniref:GntR family transcriptional regulator n=1 Tax=Escherichia coli TaxID=562 RepID=UPI001FCEF306
MTITSLDGYRWLKNDIIRGNFQPDEKLRMSLLTSRYALGVGPLREALSQLVAERLEYALIMIRSHTMTITSLDGYRWLKNDIIRGNFQPDEKLRMSLLTSRYALGVGPLREALSQLVAERL